MFRLARLLAIAAPIPASFAHGFRRLRAIWSYTCPRPRAPRVCTNSRAGRAQDSRVWSSDLLASLGKGAPEPNAHDEAHLSAAERRAHCILRGRGPQVEPVGSPPDLDLACYDASTPRRRAGSGQGSFTCAPGRTPSTVRSSPSYSIPAPVGRAFAGGPRARRGPRVGGRPSSARDRGRASLDRLIAHQQDAAANDLPMRASARELGRLLGDPEAMTIDLGGSRRWPTKRLPAD